MCYIKHIKHAIHISLESFMEVPGIELFIWIDIITLERN